MIINMNTFKQVIQSSVPFCYSMLNGLIPTGALIDLYKTAPFKSLDLTLRTDGSDKTYHLYNCLLLDHVSGEVNPDIDLSESWKTLISDFSSDAYKNNVSELTNIDVRNCYVQIMLKVYKAGSFISMHTDDQEVALTHLNFMNPYYDFNNRGNLYFHDQAGKKVVSIPPDPNISIIFPRADESYHSVDPCDSDVLPKITLQIVLWKTRKQRNLTGRQYL